MDALGAMAAAVAQTYGNAVLWIEGHPAELLIGTALALVLLLLIAALGAPISTALNRLAALAERPIRELAAHLRLAGAWVAAWPADTLATELCAFWAALLQPISATLARAAGSIASSRVRAWSAVAGEGWGGWRVIGALLFFGALVVFVYSDAGILLVSYERLTQTTIAWAPSWMRDFALQLVATSAGSALILGLVASDLAGWTHLGPWANRSTRTTLVLGALVGVLLVTLGFVALLLGIWRADQVLQNTWLSDEQRVLFAGLAQALPVPVMFGVTAIIGWGAVAVPWCLWLTLLALVASAVHVGQLLVELAQAVFGPFGQVTFTRVFQLARAVARAPFALGVALAMFLVVVVNALDSFLESFVQLFVWPGALFWNWLCRLRLLDRAQFLPVATVSRASPVLAPHETEGQGAAA